MLLLSVIETDLRLSKERKMNIVSSKTLFTTQTDERTFAFLWLLTEPKILPKNCHECPCHSFVFVALPQLMTSLHSPSKRKLFSKAKYRASKFQHFK